MIQSQFTKHGDYEAGEAALTATSMIIGKITAKIISREPISVTHQLRLGDLIIEGYLYHGFAELIPPKRRDETYILKAAPKWAELADIPAEFIKKVIVGSYQDPPSPPSAAIHKQHEHLFNPEGEYVKAIDKLQKVEWTINSRVLQAIESLKNKFTHSLNEERQRSKEIEWDFTIGKANVLKDWDKFYQTFEVDYRGRIYNTEPFLNYQSNDVAKGLLLFSTPKEIDEAGLFWLGVHTASTYDMSYDIDEIPDWCEEDYHSYLLDEGLDNISVSKMTLNDRAEWTNQYMENILNWANDSAIQFKADKPVIFLACCYEWEMIQRTGLTCLPVAIDGSNNGWQHLGAISKDTQTGELVGLVPTTIQQDFYVKTAKELMSLTKDERLNELLSSMPMKHIRKGISKRGSMTRAYSAGASKIAVNMFSDCRTEGYDETYGITMKDCNKLSRILVQAIQNVCPGPLQTMKYLQDLASFQLGKHEVKGPGTTKDFKDLKKARHTLLIEKDLTDEQLDELDDLTKELQKYSYELVYGLGEESITWSTPSGFTALYEKYTTTDYPVKARLNGKYINHKLRQPTDKPDIQGFMCGISPNYIHSMDAAHMAIVIAGWDGDFGAVHDSFSTHACDVDALLRRTKEVFIQMYDHPNYFSVIREQLTNNEDDVDQPTLGDLDIGEIEDSDYFFA